MTDRLFTELDADRVDEYGFLDLGRTPRLIRFEQLLNEPLAWVLGPPWLGKSTVARDIATRLHNHPHALGEIGHRLTLTALGSPGVEHEVPPPWWKDWERCIGPRPAVWLIDGVDEGLDRNKHLFDRILGLIDNISPDHLRTLRLVLFSRPHGELGDFRQELWRGYGLTNEGRGSPLFWLARLDKAAAEVLVGKERFPAVLDLIRTCNLQTVAGFPIVLRYLKHYPETTGLTLALVWRGVLTALLGEQYTNAKARFDSTDAERFDAACRVAAVLTLTRRDSIRWYSPDPDMPTIGTLFRSPENRPLSAAWEVCQTAALHHLPDQGSFRFQQRNVQDWLSAFALERLPLPALLSALLGPDGQLLSRLREPARLIRAMTERREIRDAIDRAGGGPLLPSDAAQPSLTEAISYLNQLEGLAQSSPWGLRLGFGSGDDLGRLRVDGLGTVLADRLRATDSPARVKELLLNVAEATRSLDATEAAVELILSDRNGTLRVQAMVFVARFGGPAHLRQLEGPIGESPGETETDRQIRGILISELLNRGLWPAWRAALHLPPRDANLLDSRLLVLERLTGLLTVEDARRLLPHLRLLTVRHANKYGQYRFPEFVSRAIDLLATQQPLPPDDLEGIIRLALDLLNEDCGWPLTRDVALRLRPNAIARHRFFAHDVEAIRSGHAEQRIAARSLLLPDDWRWLREQVSGAWADSREAWEVLYWLARQARDGGNLQEEEWRQLVALVERQMPGLAAQFEESQRRHEAERERREAERQAWDQRDPERLPVVERLQEILGRPDLSAAARMRQLGALSAARWWKFGVRGVENEELPQSLWRQVLEAFLLGLSQEEEIRTPEAEATAFSHVACSPGFAARVTEPMIRRWLPIAVRAHISSDWTDVIRACWAVSEPATEGALVEAVTREVRTSNILVLLSSIPSECWTARLDEQVLALARDGTVRPATRRELLEQVAVRLPEIAEAIAREWAAQAVSPDETDQIRQAGRNVLLVRDPTAALDLIEADIGGRGVAALEELPVLWRWRDELHVRWEKWPANLLQRLGRLLLRALPSATDQPFGGGFMTPELELRELRGRLISHLLSQADAPSQAALDNLAEMDETVRQRVATYRATVQAGALLLTANPNAALDPDALSVSEVVSLLDRSGFRLIRSEDDLLDSVLEAFRQVQQDVGHDLAMLYEAPNRKGGEDRPRKHLEEDALQAYLRRRLLERLPRIADRVEVDILREDQIARRQRLDLRVTAPCRGTGRLATVIVEVKWSTNEETRSGLVSQLGSRYLLGEGKTHGLFLVGWSGSWWPRDGTGESSDLLGLERFLQHQRDDYCRAGEPGESLRIEPFVLDLRRKKDG